MAAGTGGGVGGAPAVIVLVGPQGSGKTTLHRRLAFDPDRPGAFTGPLRTTKIPTWGDAAIPVNPRAASSSSSATPPPQPLVAVAPEPIAAVENTAATTTTTTVPARMLDLGGSPAARAEWPAALAHTPPDVVLFVVDVTTLADPAAVAESISQFKDVLYHRDVIKDGGGGPTTKAVPVRDAVVVVVFNRRGASLPAAGTAPIGRAASTTVAADDTEPISPPSTADTHRPLAAGFSGVVTDDSLDGSASFAERPMSPPAAPAAGPGPDDTDDPTSSASAAYLKAWGDLRGMLAAAVTERRGPQAVLCPGSVCAMRHAVVDADLQSGDGVPQLLETVSQLLAH